MMKGAMGCTIHKLKIFGSVIGSILVYMVNNFIFRKSSPKDFLHDRSMLKFSSFFPKHDIT